MLSRRSFIKSTGLAFVSLGSAPRFFERIAAAGTRRGRILVAVFQRGAADGLNIVVPYGEKSYYALRPSIAIPAPGAGEEPGGIDLDGFFAFHPSLRPLIDLYRGGHLAVVHAAGSPDNTRSHFDAQDYMESATPGVKSTRDGWLNRYLVARKDAKSTPFRAVSLTASMPRSLHGAAPAVAMGSIAEFDLRAGANPDRARSAFEAMYATAASPVLREAGKAAFDAVDFLKRNVSDRYTPAEGAQYPRSALGNSLRQIAHLIKSDIGLEIAFAETGGWDHHANEGGVQGQLAQRLTDFAQSLSAFHRDMGDLMSEVVVLTMSEFGRTARENGNRGTDHGHANAMFVLGGRVRGGRVYGNWPGLGQDQLYEGRDLALTTDFRDVFAEVLTRHLDLKNPSAVFPGYTIRKQNLRGFLRT